MEGLRDIKDIVEVPDHSLWILICTIFLILLALGVALFLFKNRRKRKKHLTPKEIAKAKLKSLDFNNPKDIVYGFEAQAIYFLDEKSEPQYREIVEQFSPYKYKKEVPPLDGRLKEKIEEFIKEIK